MRADEDEAEWWKGDGVYVELAWCCRRVKGLQGSLWVLRSVQQHKWGKGRANLLLVYYSPLPGGFSGLISFEGY
jgi:hypothetical protein